MKPLLIFDFDGTIADTKQVYYATISEELKKFKFSEKRVEKAIDIGLSLKKTLGKLGINWIISLYLRKRINKNVEKQLKQIKKCKDASSIKTIKQDKILVTNSLKEFAIPILKHLRLKKSFKAIFGAEDFSDKAEFIKSYLTKNNILRQDCFYIGDRVADIKVARQVGCKSVIIAGKCAWDSRKEILKHSPDFIIDDLKSIQEILGN